MTARPRKQTPGFVPETPLLRLYQAAEADDGEPPTPPETTGASGRPSSRMTLTEFYAGYVRPLLRDPNERDPKTIKQDLQSLGYWKQFTGDPPIEAIDDFICAAFVEQLKRRPGLKKGSKMSPNTVRKHCAHLQYVIDRAGPKNRRNRKGARPGPGSTPATMPRKRPTCWALRPKSGGRPWSASSGTWGCGSTR
jgi:hypothetical protein